MDKELERLYDLTIGDMARVVCAPVLAEADLELEGSGTQISVSITSLHDRGVFLIKLLDEEELAHLVAVFDLGSDIEFSTVSFSDWRLCELTPGSAIEVEFCSEDDDETGVFEDTEIPTQFSSIGDLESLLKNQGWKISGSEWSFHIDYDSCSLEVVAPA
jgi:hypothetical protein